MEYIIDGYIWLLKEYIDLIFCCHTIGILKEKSTTTWLADGINLLTGYWIFAIPIYRSGYE